MTDIKVGIFIKATKMRRRIELLEQMLVGFRGIYSDNV